MLLIKLLSEEMNTSTTLLLLSALFSFSAFAAPNKGDERPLPAEAKQLLDRLDFWEGVQREELKKRLAEKRSEVVAALKEELTKVTKKGDLDGALAIRDKIAELEKLQRPKSLVGKWNFIFDRKNRLYTFSKSGTYTGHYPDSGRRYTGRWKAEHGAVTLIRDGEKEAFATVTLIPKGKLLFKNGTFLMEGIPVK